MRKSLVLSSAISILATTPCYAVDWDSLVNSLLRNPNSNSFSFGDQNQFKTLINNREAQIDQQIDAGARAGTLTSAEEAELRAGLNAVYNHEGLVLADGNLSDAEARSLVDELSRLNLKVNAYLTNSTTTGYANIPDRRDYRGRRGNAYGYWTHRDRRDRNDGPDDPARNQGAVQAMIDSKQAELDSAIGRGSLNGSISSSDARNLRFALSQIASAERQAQADGSLSNREETNLTTQLNDLEARIKASTRVTARNPWGGWGGANRDTASYRAYLHQRIANALATRRISRSQANSLYAQERAITALEVSDRRDNNRYTFDEQRRVMQKLDQLSASIDAAIR